MTLGPALVAALPALAEGEEGLPVVASTSVADGTDSEFEIFYGMAASASSYGGERALFPRTNFITAFLVYSEYWATGIFRLPFPIDYGAGYGGTDAKETAKYTFLYPAGWKSEAVNKVDKGTNGTDCRVVNPAAKGEKVYVVTLSGVPKLGPIAGVLESVATSDAYLQDALSLAEPEDKILTERTVDGQVFYDYDVSSRSAGLSSPSPGCLAGRPSDRSDHE